MTVYPPRKGDYALPPEGVHLAVCKWEGQILLNSKYSKSPDGKAIGQLFVFQIEEEVPGKGQRFQLRRSFINPSMGGSKKKTAFRKFVEDWLGKILTDEQAEKFDTKFMLGRACQVAVQYDETGQYANIGSIMPLPKGVPNPPFEVIWYTRQDGEDERRYFERLDQEAKEWEAAQNGAPATDNGHGDEGLPY